MDDIPEKGVRSGAPSPEVGKPSPLDRPPALSAIMAERKQNHGPFSDVADVMIQTVALWERGRNWDKLNPVQEASLREVAHKVARILSGDPNFEEHWTDGAGYFMLGREGCKR